jgi:hypothetical protein
MKKIESTKCNKCISSGGGDCATCDPTGTTAQKGSEHCGYEEICRFFLHDSKIAVHDGTPCMRNHEGCVKCTYDSRVGDALGEDIEASEMLDKICWADIVLLVQGTLDKEDIHYCEGKTCNYCGKFGVLV